MASADEEARRLDQKIAEIRRKNEAILRRRKEIEEDKRLAEEQNAVVQLRPSTEDWPRERTPALKPSRRDLAGGEPQTPPSQDSSPARPLLGGRRERPGSGSRGRDLMEKGAGPPPDPRSFLFDPDRDVAADNSCDKPGRNRNDSSGQEFRGSNRGGLQREGQSSRRGGRGGRGGGGGGGDTRREGDAGRRGRRGDEAWRVERHKIDEARIERQRDADGRWRREWDNEKLDFELEGDDNKHPALTPSRSLNNRLHQWKQSPANKDADVDADVVRRPGNSFDKRRGAGDGTSSPRSPRTPGRPDVNLKSSPAPAPGTVSYDRTSFTDNQNVKIVIRNERPCRREESSGDENDVSKVSNHQAIRPKKSILVRTSRSSSSDGDGGGRGGGGGGGLGAARKNATSPSTPFTQYENMTFTIKNEPINLKRSDLEKMTEEDFLELSKIAKPPLPPFRAAATPCSGNSGNYKQPAAAPSSGNGGNYKQPAAAASSSGNGGNYNQSAADDDENMWEDVSTTSSVGTTESAPESVAATPTTPTCPLDPKYPPPTCPNVSNYPSNTAYTPPTFSPVPVELITYTPDDFICLVPPGRESLEPLSETGVYESRVAHSVDNIEQHIIDNSIVLVPSDPAVIHDSRTTSNEQSVNVDDFIVLVKPDASCEEDANAQAPAEQNLPVKSGAAVEGQL